MIAKIRVTTAILPSESMTSFFRRNLSAQIPPSGVINAMGKKPHIVDNARFEPLPVSIVMYHVMEYCTVCVPNMDTNWAMRNRYIFFRQLTI
jgi:hypothetical protein